MKTSRQSTWLVGVLAAAVLVWNGAAASTVNFSIGDVAGWTRREGSDPNPTDYVWNSNTVPLTQFGSTETSHGGAIGSSDPGGFFAAGVRVGVTLGRVRTSNTSIAAITPWDTESPMGSYLSALGSATLWGSYEEMLTPAVMGRAGEAAELELRFRAPVDETFVRARSSGDSTAIGQIGESGNVLWFKLGDESADFMSGSQVFGNPDGSMNEIKPATDFPSWVVLRTPVILGESIGASINLALNSTASAEGNFAASATGQLSFWNEGISFAGARLWDVSGLEISDFTLRNEDGIDFRRSFAVPEPATYGALAGAGLLLLAVIRRQPSRRPCSGRPPCLTARTASELPGPHTAAR